VRPGDRPQVRLQPAQDLWALGFDQADELVASLVQKPAHPSVDMPMLDRIPETDGSLADRATRSLGLEQCLPFCERGAALADPRGRTGPVRVAEHASVAGRRRATLALAAAPAPEAVLELVDREPLAMLRRFAAAGWERRKPGRRRSNAVTPAVRGDPLVEVLLGQALPASRGHAR
jgi:hypothetical protein